MAESGAIRAGRAFVELTLKTLGLDKGFGAAQKKLISFGKTVAVAGAAAVGATAAAAAGAATVFANMGSSMLEASQRTGVTVEELSALKYAAEQSGTSMEGLETSIKQMQKATVNTPKAFEALGLKIKDFQKLSPAQQILQVADRLAKIQNPAQRAAAAMRIFGRSGTELLPLFNDGAKGLRGLTDRARELGLVMSTEDAVAAERFGDSMSELWQQIRMVVFHVGALVAENIQPWAERAAESMGKILNVAQWTTRWDIVTAYIETGWIAIKQAADRIIGATASNLVEAYVVAWNAVQRAAVIALTTYDSIFRRVMGGRRALVEELGDAFNLGGLQYQVRVQKAVLSQREDALKNVDQNDKIARKIAEERVFFQQQKVREAEDKVREAEQARDKERQQREDLQRAVDTERAKKLMADLADLTKERDEALRQIGELDRKTEEQRIKELNDRIAGLRDQLREAEKQAAADATARDIMRATEAAIRGRSGNIEYNGIATAKKIAEAAAVPTRGLFNIAAGLSLRGGGAVEVGVTETAKNTKQLVELAKRGGLTFAA